MNYNCNDIDIHETERYNDCVVQYISHRDNIRILLGARGTENHMKGNESENWDLCIDSWANENNTHISNPSTIKLDFNNTDLLRRTLSPLINKVLIIAFDIDVVKFWRKENLGVFLELLKKDGKFYIPIICKWPSKSYYVNRITTNNISISEINPYNGNFNGFKIKSIYDNIIIFKPNLTINLSTNTFDYHYFHSEYVCNNNLEIFSKLFECFKMYFSNGNEIIITYNEKKLIRGIKIILNIYKKFLKENHRIIQNFKVSLHKDNYPLHERGNGLVARNIPKYIIIEKKDSSRRRNNSASSVSSRRDNEGGSQFINIPKIGKRKIRYYKNGKQYILIKGKKIKINN